MTPKFKLALLCLLALGAGFAISAFMLGVFDKDDTSGPTDIVDGGPLPAGPTGGNDALLEGEGVRQPGTSGPREVAGARGVRDGSLVGARVPHGIDLSDPEVREKELERLVRKKPIDWKAVTAILRAHPEPLTELVRDAMLAAIQTAGHRRPVLEAFAALNDGSLVKDLMDAFDDRDMPPGARRAILQALYTMPGASDEEVALALEARLSDDVRKDREILHAIAARGGAEGARAVVEYLQRVDKPQLVNPYVLRALDVSDNPKAAIVLREALETDGLSPEVQEKLLQLGAQPGAYDITRAVISLDRDGATEDVRKEAITSLARIGGEEALAYLLEKAQQPGTLGGHAVTSLGLLGKSNEKTVKLLIGALEGGGRNPHGGIYEQQVLLALGSSNDARAAPAISPHLEDPDVGVKRAAIQGLGRMRHLARDQVPAIVKQWPEGDEQTRLRVAVALATIGGKDAVNALEQMAGVADLTPSLIRTINAGLRNARRNLAKDGQVADSGGVDLEGRK